MMSSGWHWWVVVVTLINILGCVWLIVWSSGQGNQDLSEEEVQDHVWDEDLQERNNPLPRWWLYLFVGTIIFSLGYLIYYPGLGAFSGTGNWDQVSQYQEERARIDAIYNQKFGELAKLDFDELAGHTEGMEIAGRLFRENCATCHGADARGAVGFPNLADEEWLYGNSSAAIQQSIASGRTGVMPPWEAVLGEAGTIETVEYVKALAGLDADPALADAGKQRYNTICLSCHGVDGKGMQVLGAPDLTNDIWLYGHSDEALTHSIAKGRSGQMPAHKEILSEEEIKLLTAYLLSLNEAPEPAGP